MTGPVWQLTLLGEFELLDPHGETIVLSPRKVRGLLAMLVFGGAAGMSRVFLQQSLWPEQAVDNQQTSLRQAIARLKRALGDTVVVSSRDRCRLSDAFVIECDALAASPGQAGGAFMPDHSEPWFVEVRATLVRRGTSAPQQVYESPARPIEGFTQLLRWYTDRDPARAIELLRSNLELSGGVTPTELGRVSEAALRQMKSNDPLFGWTFFWKGVHTLSTVDVDSSRPWLRQAIERAQGVADHVLEAEAIYVLGLAEVLHGRIEVADRLSQRAELLGAKLPGQLMLARAADLSAHVQIHRGRTRDGLNLLEYAGERYADDELLAAQNTALRALYSAVGGHIDEALTLLEEPEKIVCDTDHLRLQMVCLLTRGLIAIKTDELDRAVAIFEDLVARAVASASNHFEVYAREALAMAAWKMRDKSVAVNHLKASNRVRKSLKMGVTEWDRQRLSDMPIN